MNDAPSTRPARTGLVMAFAWLIILTVLFAIDHVTLMRTVENAKGNANREELAATQNQVGALQSQVEALADSKPLAGADFATARKAVDTRLAALEQNLAASARTDALTPLADRIQTLEQQFARVRRSMVAPKSAPLADSTPPKPVLQDPPFSVVGSEMRGGEWFLSIAPIDAHTIGQIRILRPGDAEGAWRLDAVNAISATFTADGVTRRLSLP